MDELSFPPDAEAVRMVREGLTFPEIRQALEAYAGREIDDQGFLYLDESHRQGPHEDLPIRAKILGYDELIDVLGGS